jgi:hypothetical protein
VSMSLVLILLGSLIILFMGWFMIRTFRKARIEIDKQVEAFEQRRKARIWLNIKAQLKTEENQS